MSNTKIEMRTELAPNAETACSILQEKQSLPKVSPNEDKEALLSLCVCVYVHQCTHSHPMFLLRVYPCQKYIISSGFPGLHSCEIGLS